MKVDNINIQSSYGAFLLKDSYKSLLQYPKLKKPKSNNWAEHSGLEVDLIDPVLENQNIKLKLLCSDLSKLTDFLNKKTYRIYNFIDLDISFKLRFIGISDIKKTRNNKYECVLNLSNDDPKQVLIDAAVNLNALNFDYLLDGKNFSSYGIVPLEDTYIETETNIKPKLEIKSDFLNGVSVAKQKGVKGGCKPIIKLFIKAKKEDFIKGYYSFLNDLIKPNERVLKVISKEYKCYYESSVITRLIFDGMYVRCEFNLNLKIVN